MCTVVFIPNKNPLFVSLRDEDPNRKPALPPKLYFDNKYRYLSPRDTLGDGTWIGINEFGNIVILLNGGFKNHIKKKSYSRSRGLIVNELLESINPINDWEHIDLENIEPFTLVVWSNLLLYELVWDGDNKFKTLKNQTLIQIWSSSTLYDCDAKENKRKYFTDLFKRYKINSNENIFQILKSYDDKINGFIINREENLKTLSFTCIELIDLKIAKMYYHDLQNDKEYLHILNMENNIND